MRFLSLFALGSMMLSTLVYSHQLSEEQIREEFTNYDKDGNQVISVEQVDAAAKQHLKQFADPYITQEQLQQFVNQIVTGLFEFDTDKSQGLDFSEFGIMIQSQHDDHGHSHEEQQGQDQEENPKNTQQPQGTQTQQNLLEL